MSSETRPTTPIPDPLDLTGIITDTPLPSPIVLENITLSPESSLESEIDPEMSQLNESTKEIRIGLPTPFDGKRENLISFINECALYIDLNEAIYNTDMKRVIFILSYVKGGTAQA